MLLLFTYTIPKAKKQCQPFSIPLFLRDDIPISKFVVVVEVGFFLSACACWLRCVWLVPFMSLNECMWRLRRKGLFVELGNSMNCSVF